MQKRKKGPLSGPQNQHINYSVRSAKLHETSCMYSFNNEPDISSRFACRVGDVKRRQLSQLQPKVPDTYHN